MNEQRNTEIVKQAYDSFKRGDIQAVLGLMSEDINWRLPQVENMPQSGQRRGINQVTEFFSLLAQTQDVKEFEPREFIAQGDRVVALGHYAWTAKETGRDFESDFVHVFTVRNGKVTGFDEYFDTATVAAAFQKAQAA
jgi:ketosteroid isomerase-like protein